MLNILHDLWIESPPIHAPGFIAALIVAGFGSYLSFAKLKAKTWSAFSVSLAVGLCCFVSLLGFAIIGLFVVNASAVESWRGLASFADAYVWGVFYLPFLACILSFCCFALTKHSSRTR